MPQVASQIRRVVTNGARVMELFLVEWFVGIYPKSGKEGNGGWGRVDLSGEKQARQYAELGAGYHIIRINCYNVGKSLPEKRAAFDV